jgi:hypothetical protein
MFMIIFWIWFCKTGGIFANLLKEILIIFAKILKIILQVGALVASYCPALAREGDSAAPGAAPTVRKFNKQITNEDRQRLNGHLVNCRRSLVDSNLLRKPLDDGGKGFIKNTLRKLSARKLEKLRAEALTNEQVGWSRNYCSRSEIWLLLSLKTFSK